MEVLINTTPVSRIRPPIKTKNNLNHKIWVNFITIPDIRIYINISKNAKPNSADFGIWYFTFAIISDLNGGEREGIYNVAVEQINRLEPTFVLSVGDLIDGGTEDSLQLKKEWDSFGARTSKLDMPFFYLGGNHDLTNPKMRAFWKQRFGPRYYHFVYKDVLFLMMDSEDFEEKHMMEIYYARAKAIDMNNEEFV